ncbi:MAG TPA: thymidine kinase [Ignavibacteriaceae bacterium]|nr:thymidine kinase [Ignavibacteriaceae bacterium]HRP92881.1 thymidine kinase [Ignavibacteriaceae bacterium]HRQ54216.1 thymidine kinase [Ignavibacteriaceae bacterium]
MEPKPHAVPKDSGWIEVITGCMFSGKTEELIRRLRRAKIAKQKVVIFKPIIDTRYSNNSIVSHSEQSLPSVLIKDVNEILDLVEDAQIIGIDEAQFFSNDIINVCNKLADDGKRVIVAGLDMDYRGIPFEPIPQLLSVAEYITKSLAICVECGNPADRTQRKTASSERVIVGAADVYEARCRKCHFIPTEESE